MQTIDPVVQEAVDLALAGEGFDKGMLLHLFSVEPHSLEFYLMMWCVRKLKRIRCNETAEVHAQIGLDAQPCPGNCFHCSYAARFNTRTPDEYFLSLDEIVDYAVDFTNRGANGVTLMCTAAYDFDRMIETILAVRQAIGSEMPIMANMGDFDEMQAERLVESGVGSIFHAVRMGEGAVNDIPLEQRFRTYSAARSAGMKIASSIENVTPGFTDDEIADMMIRLRYEVEPQLSGCTSKRLVKGTDGFGQPDFPPDNMRVYQLSYNLLMSSVCTFVGGTMMWAEAGTNPRDWSLHTEVDGLIKQRGSSIEGFFREFEQDGYCVRPGPSKRW